MNNLLLSICIPTYNRSVFLKQLLQSILLEIDRAKLRGFVEIIISDNCSTDDTAGIVKQYSAFLPIEYKCQSQPLLPAELNFYYVAMQAKGKYVWVIGDDDSLAENALIHVSECLQSDLDLYVCNFSIMTQDFLNQIKKYEFSRIIPVRMKDGHELLKRFGTTLSFISISIFKSAKFKLVPFEMYSSFAKYALSYLYAVYYCGSNSNGIGFISQNIILYRSSNAQSDDKFWLNVFVVGMHELVTSFKTLGYRAHDIKSGRKKTLVRYVINRILIQKSLGADIALVQKTVQDVYGDLVFYWIVCYPLFLIPNFILVFLRNCYRKLNGRSKFV